MMNWLLKELVCGLRVGCNPPSLEVYINPIQKTTCFCSISSEATVQPSAAECSLELSMGRRQEFSGSTGSSLPHTFPRIPVIPSQKVRLDASNLHDVLSNTSPYLRRYENGSL